MPNNSDGDGKERKFRYMMDLVKFCLESTAKEDAQGPSSGIGPMDEDRRAWLQNVISSLTIDTTKVLLENLAIVKETVVDLKREVFHPSTQKTCNALEVLTDLCENIDYACDFMKLDGFSIFEPLISCGHDELRVKACELIAALAQNNPLCQKKAMEIGLLESLLHQVNNKRNQTFIKAKSYALYAMSSIIRSNQEVRDYFETKLDGLTVLLDILDDQQLETNTNSPPAATSQEENRSSSAYWWRKLRIRTVFLLRTLCSVSVNASKFIYEKQAIKQVTNQLKNIQDPEIREHLLNALKAFLISLDSTKQVESLKLAPDLLAVVKEIHNLSLVDKSSDDYDMTDTKSTCEELINLIETSMHLQKK